MRTLRFLLLASLAALGGCVTPHFEDPINVMTSTQAYPEKRRAAAAQARQEMPADPRRIAALKTILWDGHFPAEEQTTALNELVALDEAQFRKDVAQRILLIDHYEVLEKIFALAVDRQWQEFTPTAVRHYARPIHGMADANRPERAVIEKLNPGKTVEQVVFEVFINRPGEMKAEAQGAAWELINRLNPRESVVAAMAQAPETSPMVIDLKAAAADLHAVPINREGVLWLSYLRDPARRAWWDRAKALVARLSPEQLNGLELRHLPTLLVADDATLGMTRRDLSLAVRRSLADAEHHMLAPSFDGQDRDYPQSFNEWEAKLTWADLACIRVIAGAVADRAVVQSFFAQADEDLLDETTEYGGALLVQEQGGQTRFAAKLFKPMVRRSDARYLAPPALIESLYTGVAHYHFHAQRQKNKEYAGPGRGDQELAGRLNFNFLVLTFIDHERLNIDFYTPKGAVVDLGTLRR
ncbi:MAG: hypothetical protein NTW19_00445 [Planctomycetota bacterium]|nr:hypothetical protein [Planctomycetota bacterium]